MIDKFDGDYAFLSNFYPSEITMPDGITYPSVEHAYQAHKTTDLEIRKHMSSDTISAAYVKKYGRKLKIREDWDQIKISVMLKALELKFKDRELSDKLKETDPHELVEGNWWGDTFWGVCDGKGTNWLGTLLMLIRSKQLWWE